MNSTTICYYIYVIKKTVLHIILVRHNLHLTTQITPHIVKDNLLRHVLPLLNPRKYNFSWNYENVHDKIELIYNSTFRIYLQQC